MITNPPRKKLMKRAREQIAMTSGVTPKNLLKTPSQKSSERGRNKYARRAGVELDRIVPPTSDCRGCNECDHHDLDICDKISSVARCKQCGQRVRFRVIFGEAWECCPVCTEEKR